MSEVPAGSDVRVRLTAAVTIAGEGTAESALRSAKKSTLARGGMRNNLSFDPF